MQTKEDREFVEKLRSLNIGAISGGTPKFYKRNHEDMTQLYRENNNPLAEITKDKAMFRAITEGNASDKSLKRDVEIIERNRVQSEKKKSRDAKLKKVNDAKMKYKKKYGVNPL
jgi:hypothetical protein